MDFRERAVAALYGRRQAWAHKRASRPNASGRSGARAAHPGKGDAPRYEVLVDGVLVTNEADDLQCQRPAACGVHLGPQQPAAHENQQRMALGGHLQLGIGAVLVGLHLRAWFWASGGVCAVRIGGAGPPRAARGCAAGRARARAHTPSTRGCRAAAAPPRRAPAPRRAPPRSGRHQSAARPPPGVRGGRGEAAARGEGACGQLRALRQLPARARRAGPAAPGPRHPGWPSRGHLAPAAAAPAAVSGPVPVSA